MPERAFPSIRRHGARLAVLLAIAAAAATPAGAAAREPLHDTAPPRGFGLPDLQRQLHALPVVSGDFLQEKFLRPLPRALTSTGRFILNGDDALLWQTRTPLVEDLRIHRAGVDARAASGAWQPLPAHDQVARQAGLFLAALAGDTSRLQESFTLHLAGSAAAWSLRLIPRGALLARVFVEIRLEGDDQVRRIELRETSGDRSVIDLRNIQARAALDDEQRRALAD
jgi:hypothetical protein